MCVEAETNKKGANLFKNEIDDMRPTLHPKVGGERTHLWYTK